MRVGFATSAALPDLYPDDRAAIAPLRALGIDVVPTVWNDAAVDWASLDAVVVRSTWDYFREYPAFLAWLDRVAGTTALINPVAVLRWNSHKAYLFELAAEGIPIVPTAMVRDPASAVDRARAEGWHRAVVKPTVSGNAWRTYRVDTAAFDPARPPWAADPPSGDVLVQPYVEEVERSGERSLVFFRGRYSHAFLRASRLGGPGGPTEGGAVRASGAELELAERAIAAAPAPCVYARVDLVVDPNAGPQLMELEVVEPLLRLEGHRGAAEAFAAAIAESLG